MKKLFNCTTYKSMQSSVQQVPMKTEDQFSSLSEEQEQYVKYDFLQKNEDTILIACAGSGKTRSMIEKMRYLALRQMLNKDQMLVFSYSKLTIEHMKICCKSFADMNIFSNIKLIKTIDSFCFDIIKKLGQECAVQILSAKVCGMLQDSARQLDQKKSNDALIRLLRKSKYRKIRAIFIDEAQDLNQIQYSIILALKQILGCTLHFIGDPNQNIYQFRESYEKYLLQHEGMKFHLSVNFRCLASIDEFSQSFKYYNFANQSKSSKNYIANQDKVCLCINNQFSNDQFIVNEIKRLLKQGFKANHIAVISPNIGDQFNSGVIRVANLLNKNDIATVNYYNEMREDNQKRLVRGKSKRVGVNLLTIHGSKGLEFGVVFLIKFSDKMLQCEQFDAQYVASQNMNLLYVAITRAKQRLYIIHDQSENIAHKHVCSLIINIPNSCYTVNGNIEQHMQAIQKKLENRRQIVDENVDFLSISQLDERKHVLLAYKESIPHYFEINCSELKYQQNQFKWNTSVTQFIQKISQQDMLQIMNMMSYKKKCEQIFEISDESVKIFQDLRYNQEALIGCLFEYVFFYQIQQYRQKPITVHKIIFHIKDIIMTQTGIIKLNETCLISDRNQLNTIKQFLVQVRVSNMSQKEVSDQIHKIQQSHQISDTEYLTVNNNIKNNTAEFLDFGNIGISQLELIIQNSEQIFSSIDQFNSHQDWKQLLPDIIYIVLLRFAIKTKHQKYIQYNKQQISDLCKFESIFQHMTTLAKELATQDIQYQFEVSNDDMIGYIDFLVLDTNQNIIIDMKVQNDLSVENILQLLLYDILLEDQIQMQLNNRLVIINCMKGVKYEIIFDKRDELLTFMGKLMHEDFQKRTNAE